MAPGIGLTVFNSYFSRLNCLKLCVPEGTVLSKVNDVILKYSPSSHARDVPPLSKWYIYPAVFKIRPRNQ